MSRRGAAAEKIGAVTVAKTVSRRRKPSPAAVVHAAVDWEKPLSDLTWDDLVLRSEDLSRRADRLLVQVRAKR